MAFTYFEIYADESRIDGGGTFFLGALRASPRRIEILRDRVKKFRATSECLAEMKWTKVSRGYLEKYKQFVDIVLCDQFVRFSVREVLRDSSWHQWDRPEDELRFAMNTVARQRFELKKSQVRSLAPASSHGDDVLQLVDVLLGALTSSATAKHKVELADYVRGKLDANCDVWSVDLTKVKGGESRARRPLESSR